MAVVVLSCRSRMDMKLVAREALDGRQMGHGETETESENTGLLVDVDAYCIESLQNRSQIKSQEEKVVFRPEVLIEEVERSIFHLESIKI